MFNDTLRYNIAYGVPDATQVCGRLPHAKRTRALPER
jgi:ABC-type multidrug transport system fused ATPase/permease subunit